MAATPWELLELTMDQWHGLPTPFKLGVGLGQCLGADYPASDAEVCYPSAVPGIPVQRVVVPGGQLKISCSPLTMWLLACAWPRLGWNGEDYGDVVLYADRLPARPDAPISCVERKHLGKRLQKADAWVQGAFHLVQGWRQLQTMGDAHNEGHALLVQCRPGAAELLVVESTSRKSPLNGKAIGVRCVLQTPEVFAARFPRALYRAVLG